MSLPLTRPPESLCLLRLSAVGDVCHALPVIRSLQKAWPQTRLTWVIGKQEHSLLAGMEDVEFIIFDKSAGISAYRELKRQMRGRHFEVLLHMQMSLRASLASLLIPARIRLGFDRQRANDLQWLFTNHKIPHRDRQHVVDSFFGFIETLGVRDRQLEWNIPVSEQDRQTAQTMLPNRPCAVISPCSSQAYRNWSIDRYASIADYLNETHGLDVVLTGGPSAIEREYANGICRQARHRPIDLVGKTSLPQLLVILEQARLVISPDSGPAHMATAVHTPVVGLYATTNPDRAGPYLSLPWVVNRYPEAIETKYGKSVAEVPWGTRVRDEGTMDRIAVDDVVEKIEQALTQNRP